MTVTLTGRLICANAAEAQILRDHIGEHVRLTREEPGCEHFEITPTGDPMVWQVDERFASESAFEAHQARTKASIWGQVSTSIGREFQVTKDE